MAVCQLQECGLERSHLAPGACLQPVAMPAPKTGAHLLLHLCSIFWSLWNHIKSSKEQVKYLTSVTQQFQTYQTPQPTAKSMANNIGSHRPSKAGAH
jgi:hypothetical protein